MSLVSTHTINLFQTTENVCFIEKKSGELPKEENNCSTINIIHYPNVPVIYMIVNRFSYFFPSTRICNINIKHLEHVLKPKNSLHSAYIP